MNATVMMVCLVGNAAVGQDTQTLFKAPRIEIKSDTYGGKPFSYLLYNRVYLGQQYLKTKDAPDLPRLPTTYFHDKGPIGIVLRDAKAFPPKASPPVMVLGMDVGTLAAYAQPGQTFHFTERVPTFVKLSMPDKGEKRYFTFVQDALDRGAKVTIFEGEPRDMLEKHGPAKFYKLIVVESYKLPVIEVHKELMTKEALQLLMSKVREDGIVAFHTSNRYYVLSPIIASAVKELGLACVVGTDNGDYERPANDFRFSSEWVMVARDAKYLSHLKNGDANQVQWGPAMYGNTLGGKFVQAKIDREFLWTDKGEQSFRGLFRSDPEIDRLQDGLRDLEDFFVKIGISSASVRKASQPVHGAIRTWSATSAERLNQGSPFAPTGTKKDKK